MKNMRKALAVLFALTLAAGMTACGETGGTAADSSSAAETSAAETSAAESSEDSAEESAAAETSAAESREEAASNGDYVMETHSTEHAPLGIKLDYDLPQLADYNITTNTTNPHYFSTTAEDSYFYRKEDKSTYGIDVYFTTGLWGKDNVKFSFEGDQKTLATTDKGYTVSYTTASDKTIKANGEEVGRLDANLAVYGESYRDAVLITQIKVTSSELDMTPEECEKFALALAYGIHFTEWDENACFTDDGSFKVYPHKFIYAPKATIAGKEVALQLITSQGYPEAFAEFNLDDIHYEMNTDILTYNSLKWEKTAEKTDEYVSVKIAGYDGFAKLESFGCNGDFIVKFSDEHVEEIKISAKSYADGSSNKDGKSFHDLQNEMIGDANKANTIAKMTEYVSAFVGAWTLDDTVQEPK